MGNPRLSHVSVSPRMGSPARCDPSFQLWGERFPNAPHTLLSSSPRAENSLNWSRLQADAPSAGGAAVLPPSAPSLESPCRPRGAGGPGEPSASRCLERCRIHPSATFPCPSSDSGSQEPLWNGDEPPQSLCPELMGQYYFLSKTAGLGAVGLSWVLLWAHGCHSQGGRLLPSTCQGSKAQSPP